MESLEKAKKLFIAKKYKESFSLFKSTATSSPEASYYLAMHYYIGLAAKKNYDKALTLFKKSWEGLYPEGIYMMGKMYEAGHGVEQNIDQAFKYYQAATHSINAKTRLAQMYEEGIGTEKDMAKAIRLYNELRKDGSGYAMYKIGRFYLTGHGLKKNLKNGYLWLRKALEKDHLLAVNYFRLLGTTPPADSRTTEDILEQAKAAIQKNDKEYAMSHLEVAIKEGSKEALFLMVDMYLTGELVEKDEATAFKLLLKHQELNDSDVYYKIGYFYESGTGVLSSYYKAAIFYEKASQLNHESAKLALRDLRGY
ncbi:MAG: tetratricopeptide repeat protein [Tenericutes bacterium]|jgi:TPR repeat protein|nr:tetratricopeptide repeat protein [Mycoplasmatota bacterium]